MSLRRSVCLKSKDIDEKTQDESEDSTFQIPVI